MSQFQSGQATQASQSAQEKHVVLLDTDIGDDIDDALALALALHAPEIDLQGVTTVFGDTLLRARLAKHLLHVFGRDDIPVAAGISTPLQARHRPSGVPQAAILDTCQPADISPYSGPELIAQKALASPGRLTLLCIGPLTNVATALLNEPRLFMAIRSIIMMGGTSGIPWPEWNTRSDARAAQIVLAAGIPITLLGWNITTRCQLLPGDLERLSYNNSPQTRLLSQLMQVWQRHRPRWHSPYPYLHDPLTVAALCAPGLLRFEEMTARTLAQGPLRGFMVPRLMDGPLVQAAVDIQVAQAREWIMERLLPQHS
ncbi:MAG TPA: nucleoside hydrolase [Ktedonobacteraceae bacterium]|nr:nucleoside hydrolase [Ktedonobacteraceae bacterium]